jgi:hypothetical protein
MYALTYCGIGSVIVTVAGLAKMGLALLRRQGRRM